MKSRGLPAAAGMRNNCSPRVPVWRGLCKQPPRPRLRQAGRRQRPCAPSAPPAGGSTAPGPQSGARCCPQLSGRCRLLLSHHDYFLYSIHHHFYLERSLYTKKGKEKITIHDMQILTFRKCIGSICKLFLYLHFKMTWKYFGYIFF